MRLFTVLLSLAQKLGAISDYVIEEGTSGIWDYKKWNNGLMEAWMRERNTFTVTPVEILGGYYGATPISVPSGFKSRPVGFASGYLGSGIGFAATSRNTTTQVNVFVLSNANNATMTLESLYIYGTWK